VVGCSVLRAIYPQAAMLSVTGSEQLGDDSPLVNMYCQPKLSVITGGVCSPQVFELSAQTPPMGQTVDKGAWMVGAGSGD